MYNRSKNKTKNELVFNLTENKWQYFTRQSNQTLTCKPGKVLDLDRLYIEDRYGHRYERKIYPYIPDKWFFESY